VAGNPGAEPQTLVGAMFVSTRFRKVTAPYPVVMIHGQFKWQQFLGTPDDRKVAEYFVRRGYPVYVVDQPAGVLVLQRPGGWGADLGPVETTNTNSPL